MESCFSSLMIFSTKLSISCSWLTMMICFMVSSWRTSLSFASCSVLKPSVGSSRMSKSLVVIAEDKLLMAWLSASL